ncbi:hypothetical protein COCVIDRAFT_31239 [Bipolaris victoriae FI3]|uniref:AAA+ ATPase domain-containing protein n=1 Tax=Bipolaris victoriae (strain FI3) TaxID=930091 RepID=W7E6J3_BIPV3|nr:hypothetical protein COCVIDRAFT_31239 [Bipolaris victoriae FI3]
MNDRGAGQHTVQSSDTDLRTHASQALGEIDDVNADTDIRKSHIAEKDQGKSLGPGDTSKEPLPNGVSTNGAIEKFSDTQQISLTKVSSTTAGAKADDTQEKSTELFSGIDQRDQKPKIEKPEEPAATEEARAKTVVNSWNDEEDKWEDRAYVVEGSENRRLHAVIFRQQMDIDNNKKLSYKEIEVHSQNLLVLLKKILHVWKDISTEFDQPAIVLSPFHNFVCHWKDYEDATKDAEGDTESDKLAKSDLETVLDLIKKSSVLKSYLRSRDIMRVCETIMYEFVWTLFGHGTRVVARSFLNELQMFQVKDYAESPDGEKRIDNLTVYPAKYYGTGDAYGKLQESSRNRGKTASSFRNVNSDDSGTDQVIFDIIEGKGHGLVILLHGPPGVGKTLTAETIALEIGRPLLTISVTEIGVDYRIVEHNLTNVFVDAARWEAVLLMEEVEVFVEQRGGQDMDQNALVSVMLRCLEYFKGIVIMTTNRVKSIDVAIQSRVQLAIRYQDLNPTQMLKIYQGRLMRISAEEIEDMTELMKSLEKSPLIKLRSSEVPPNGRQIRNIVTHAWALAKSEEEKLNIQHLQSVANMTLDFTESMKDLTMRQRDMSEVDR